jgi:hypothetical protein
MGYHKKFNCFIGKFLSILYIIYNKKKNIFYTGMGSIKMGSINMMLRILVIITFLMAAICLADNRSVGIQYLYPKPGTKYIPPEAKLIVRFKHINPKQIGNLASLFTVSGTKSGPISGTTSLISDGRTIHFMPDHPFQLSEQITVRLMPSKTGDRLVSYLDTSYTFQISSNPDPFASIQETAEHISFPDAAASRKMYKKGNAFEPVVLNGISIPSDFPWIDITINDNPDPGYIFLNNWDGQPYNVIFDNSGAPIWYWRTPDRRRDFKVQKDGNLSMLIRGGYGGGYGHIVLDSTYTVIDVLRAADGYATDEHELQIQPDGHWFVIGIRGEEVDMSQYVDGGRTDATVHVGALQAFSPNGELLLCVSAWELYDIRDTEIENLTGGSFRFPHMNAIDIDEDGHILISSRHMSEVTKIHRETGSIIWRLGGAHSDFTFENDDELNGFRSQHDIRVLGDGHYTVFDNGNLHNPPVSRAVEYALDTTAMTATLVWQFRDTPDKYTDWMGNAQRLPNGNTLINWADGSLPKLTEVRPNGEKAFEMDFVEYAHCYRLFRFPWKGIAKVPYLVVEGNTECITLLFNKFGDSTIDHYNIYGDTRSSPTQLLATTDQSFINLFDLENGKRYWFRVTAVDNMGTQSGYSNEEEVLVNITPPGTNLLFNSDFSDGRTYWNFERSGTATAVGVVDDGVFQFYIVNGGSEIWNVQLYQQDLTLVEGRDYTFAFDAWADEPRIIEAKVGKASDPFTNYSKIGMTYITQEKERYNYPFTMENQTDQDCRVVVNCGNSDIHVYLDNVFLSLGEPNDADLKFVGDPLPQSYKLSGNYPNPFNNATIINYQLSKNSEVELTVYDILGKKVSVLASGMHAAGTHTVRWNASDCPAGIYFIQLKANGRIRDAQKMIYLK